MASATIPARLSSDEFVRIYDRDEGLRSYELFDGEVVDRPVPNFVHDLIKNAVMAALVLYLNRARQYMPLVETTFKLSPGITFTPDLAVILRSRYRGNREKFASGSPEIAFEVISSESADRLKFKTDAYLEHGTRAVCCIYATQKKIMVFEPRGITEIKGDQLLEFPAILPGFSMPLSAVFESLDD